MFCTLQQRAVSTSHSRTVPSSEPSTSATKATGVCTGCKPLPAGIDRDTCYAVRVAGIHESLRSGERLQVARVRQLRQQRIRVDIYLPTSTQHTAMDKTTHKLAGWSKACNITVNSPSCAAH